MAEKRLSDYFDPRSLTWWSGATLIASGVLELAGASIPVVSDVARPILDEFAGGGGPIARVTFGTGLIGIGRKIEAMKAAARQSGDFTGGNV